MDFSVSARPQVSVQELTDGVKDGETLHIPSGYYSNSDTWYIKKNLTAVGDGVVVIDGRRQAQILQIKDPKLVVKLQNITFANGICGDNGAAIINSARELTIDRCQFVSNIATKGSAIYNLQAKLRISNCTIRNNFAFNQSCIHGIAGNGQIIIDNCMFDGNIGGYSNCVSIEGESSRKTIPELESICSKIVDGIDGIDLPLVIHRCTFINNSGYTFPTNDGGLGCSIVVSTGPGAAIIDSIMDSNKFIASGGIIATVRCPLILKHCTISNNIITTACLLGSGVTLTRNSSAVIDDCEIYGNYGSTPLAFYSKGAICVIDSEAKVTNCSIYQNRGSDGGGIYNSGILTLDSDLILSNNALIGAGIHNAKGGQLVIEGKSYIINNMAEDKGGAIYNEGAMCLKGSSISTNTPDDIYNL